MFMPSYIPQNRNVAAFLYHTRKNIKIIRIEMKQKLQQKQTTRKIT